MSSPPTLDATFALARDVSARLEARGVKPLVIGAVALAVHGYPRQTSDVDLAVAVPPSELLDVAAALRAAGLEVDVSLPDADDPLGGVLTVRSSGAFPVQLVNFDNAPGGGFPALVHSALPTATVVDPDLPIPVVDVGSLILFKLYSGGLKSEHDILELLVRNPVDLDELRARARAVRLERALERVLERAQPG